MPRPLIGITTYLEAARWGTWVREAALSPLAYGGAVEKCGGAPVLLPPINPASAEAYLEGMDGVILSGGAIPEPSLYGASADDLDPDLEEPQPHRDRFELALGREAIKKQVPVLALGRGMHILNIAQGGTLIPWLPASVGNDRHAPSSGVAAHVIQISISSQLGKAVGDRVEVVAPHQQAVKRLGSGLLAVAWAQDQIVEGIEMQGHPFCIGIQWHPERGDDLRVYQAFVDAAGG